MIPKPYPDPHRVQLARTATTWTVRPDTDDGWVGRARMAAAKAAAGGTLTDLEAEALRLHPEPARIAIGGYR